MWMLNWIWIFWNWVVFIGRVRVKIVWSCWVIRMRERSNLIVIWEGKRGRMKGILMRVEVFLGFISLVVGDILISGGRKMVFLNGI